MDRNYFVCENCKYFYSEKMWLVAKRCPGCGYRKKGTDWDYHKKQVRKTDREKAQK
jgi:RNA polymerase subunit RPABC4/transcription elongation factor Spt4